MANKRHKPEEIVTKLRQVEVLVVQGMARIDAIREIGVVDMTLLGAAMVLFANKS
jgi:putative transposase